jgi:hypothetical protein
MPKKRKPPAKAPESPGFALPNPEDLGTESLPPYIPVEANLSMQSAIERVKEQHEGQLLAIDGVVGVGIQQDTIGNPVIAVYVRDAAVKNKLPATVGGYPIVVTVTGDIDAYRAP